MSNPFRHLQLLDMNSDRRRRAQPRASRAPAAAGGCGVAPAGVAGRVRPLLGEARGRVARLEARDGERDNPSDNK